MTLFLQALSGKLYQLQVILLPVDVLCNAGYGDMLSFSQLFGTVSLMQELTIYFI